MTQTVPPPPPNISQLQRRIAYLEEVNESQKRTINALQNETRWLTGVIFNSAYNEVDIRLLVQVTPRELRMGYSYEAQEKTVYLPDLARKVHSSTSTVPKRIKRLEEAGLFHYRSAKDPDTGNTRAFLETRPTLAQAGETTLEEAHRGGGSTWQDGKRMKRCKDCGSEHLVEITKKQIVCNDCGALQEPVKETRRAINANETPYSHGDGESETSESEVDTASPPAPDFEEEAHHHRDGEPQENSTDPSTDTGTVFNTIDYHGDGEPDILSELKNRRIWTCGRYEVVEGKEKPDKVPYVADLLGSRRASSTNPSTWRTHEFAVACYEKSQAWDPNSKERKPFDFIMFMCDGTFTFFDQDGCRNPETGEITQDAMERARAINSYTELSVSGHGLHTYAWGTIPENRKDTKRGVEIYDHARPCVFTGQPVPDFPQTMEKRQEELLALHRQLFPERPGPDLGSLWNDDSPCSQSVDEVLEKAMSARNSAKFSALFKGEWQKYYSSQSEADLGLCRMIAHWCNKSVSIIDSIFRQSGLYRTKWEREDYRTNTMRLAVSSLGSQNEEVA